jgi:glycosyltransferase involved in cell wall biosynthesis
MRIVRAGRRYTFPLYAKRAFRRIGNAGFDLLVEDINKSPLFTPRWSEVPVVGLVPHLFGTTAFREAPLPVAAGVWLAERRMLPIYEDVPVQAISQSTKDDLERRGFSAERITVVYPGVDHETYRPNPEVARFEQPTFVYVGRLKRYKGLEVVVEALERLTRSGWTGRLVVAGKGDDEARLRRVVQTKGLESNVEFAGFVDEDRKVELLRRAWAAVYPSPKEGWGLANVEAAACGTPAIASDSPGLRESVAHDVSGFLVRHEDPAEWASRIRELSEQPERRDRLSSGAIEHASRFSWERAADETEAWLEAALRRRTGLA